MDDIPCQPGPDGQVGLPWFRPEAYADLRGALADRADLPPTYAAWLQGAEAAQRALEARRLKVQRVAIERDDLLGWCARFGETPDAAGRQRYADRQVWVVHSPGRG